VTDQSVERGFVTTKDNNTAAVAAEPEAPAPIELKAPPTKPLQMNRCKLVTPSSCDMANLWAAVLPADVPFSATLQPEFWSNHASQIRVGDQIQCHVDSRAWFGVGYVSGVGKNRVFIEKLQYAEFDARAPSTELVAYCVSFEGPHRKFIVARHGVTIQEGIETREAAEQVAKAHERADDRRKVA
jgi:hypothetical protein